MASQTRFARILSGIPRTPINGSPGGLVNGIWVP